MTIASGACTKFIAKFAPDRVDPEASLESVITFFSKNDATVLREDFDTAPPR